VQAPTLTTIRNDVDSGIFELRQQRNDMPQILFSGRGGKDAGGSSLDEPNTEK
jgi:hypothetical protein